MIKTMFGPSGVSIGQNTTIVARMHVTHLKARSFRFNPPGPETKDDVCVSIQPLGSFDP